MSRTGVPDEFNRWFEVDAVRTDLRSRSVRSGAYAVAARGATVTLNLLAVTVLARVLRPEDFGVLAMVLPLTILFNSVAKNGLQNAVMHEEHLDRASASAFFRFAALVNLVLALLMAVSGPLLSRVYDDARATAVAMVWAAILYLTTLASVHEAMLKRQLLFGRLLTANLIGLSLGIVVAITVALAGGRHWALLAQFAVMDLFSASAAWWFCRWRPTLRGEASAASGVHRLRSYWRNLSGFRVLNWLAMHPDRILVGNLGGAATLGLYDSARRWAFYPVTELFMSLSDVAVATFSRVAHDAARYRDLLRRAMLPVLALPLPAIAFVFVAAEDVVRLLLGSQWVGAVPFVRWMCVASFMAGLGRATQWFYLSRGDLDRQFRWALFVQTPLMLAGVLIGIRWGAIGVAAGFTVATSVLAIPSVAWSLVGSSFRFRDYATVAARPVIGALAAAGAVAASRSLFADPSSILARVAVHFAIFAIVYSATWLALPGGRHATAEILTALRELRPRSARATVSS